MSDSVRPQGRQPTRLPRPWDSPGKNTGVGCYFLLQCMKVKSESEVAQLCPTPSDPMDCSPPGSSIHGIFPGKSTGVGYHCLLLVITITAIINSCIKYLWMLKLAGEKRMRNRTFMYFKISSPCKIFINTWWKRSISTAEKPVR